MAFSQALLVPVGTIVLPGCCRKLVCSESVCRFPQVSASCPKHGDRFCMVLRSNLSPENSALRVTALLSFYPRPFSKSWGPGAKERGDIGGPASDAGWGSRKERMGCEPGNLEAARPKSWAGRGWPSFLAWVFSDRPLYLPRSKSHYVFIGGCLVNVQALIGMIFLHPCLAVILV